MKLKILNICFCYLKIKKSFKISVLDINLIRNIKISNANIYLK